MLAGDADGRVLLKVAANLAIPFLTSSTGALLAVRQPLSALPRADSGCAVTGTAGPLPEQVDVLVVGAGQAGLGVAHRLRDHPELRVLVVDALPVGESWRERWESLQLFTPRRFSALPGMRFPAGPTRSPSRLEMAAYLGSYVARFDLPVRTGVQVPPAQPGRAGVLRRDEPGPGARPAGRAGQRALPPAFRPPGCPRPWTRPSCSCTPRSTSARATSRPERCSSSAAATRPPSSPWSCRGPTR